MEPVYSWQAELVLNVAAVKNKLEVTLAGDKIKKPAGPRAFQGATTYKYRAIFAEGEASLRWITWTDAEHITQLT